MRLCRTRPAGAPQLPWSSQAAYDDSNWFGRAWRCGIVAPFWEEIRILEAPIPATAAPSGSEEVHRVVAGHVACKALILHDFYPPPPAWGR